MSKYKQWLNNSDAIELRTQGERYLAALDNYGRAYDDLNKINALKKDAEFQLWQHERIMRDSAYKLAQLLRSKVPRYIKGGTMIDEDE